MCSRAGYLLFCTFMEVTEAFSHIRGNASPKSFKSMRALGRPPALDCPITDKSCRGNRPGPVIRRYLYEEILLPRPAAKEHKAYKQ